MRLEFARYTDITEFAKKLHPDKYNEYNKIFICSDVKTVWVARVLEGYDEDYNNCEDSFILERNNIDRYEASDMKRMTLLGKSERFVEIILEEDDLSNWDFEVCDSEEEAIDMLDDGFGIIEEDS